MTTSAVLELEVERDIDVIEEMRLRTWARQNYVPADERDDDGVHPIILDEMLRKDHEFT
jgi:hypothetical protein